MRILIQLDKEHPFEHCHMENILELRENHQGPLGSQTLHNHQLQVVRWDTKECWLDLKMEPAAKTIQKKEI
jgi:hypothetical protein